MLDTMTSISGTFNSKLIDSLKSGKRFRLVGDNINFKMGVSQERKSVGKVGHIQHWFGSAAIVQNVNFQAMDNDIPQCDLRLLPTETFIICEEELQEISNNFSVLSSRVLVEFFPWLKPSTACVNEAIAVVPQDLKKKNTIIPLPIMHKNQSSN
ncbi:hypothetical protein DPMN_122620 [Dreissena polymorpha]|uniref:Uncharacterized protein n=2 Tax=Dreissena polymorpha TaxID=45954 RepID=A0A9D4GSX1_DREPO|nr:hypothetical protein DPMN_122620 [Dreissena polymorpha]